MRRTRFDDWDCSIARTVDLLGDWWTPMVVRGASSAPAASSSSRRALGIPRNVLAERLSPSSRTGILTKQPYQERPVRYEYRLTEKGIALYPVIIVDDEVGRRVARVARRAAGRAARPRDGRAGRTAAASTHARASRSIRATVTGASARGEDPGGRRARANASSGSVTLIVVMPIARAGLRLMPRSSRNTTSLAATPSSLEHELVGGRVGLADPVLRRLDDDVEQLVEPASAAPSPAPLAHRRRCCS